MAYDSFLFPMATFKEIEPTLKKCFNIDRNTPTIAKCICESFTANELINTKIPETYLLEDDHYDIFAYSMDYAESIRIPLSETCSTKDFNNFCQSNNIEYETTLYEILAFLLLFNDTSNKKYYTGLDEAREDFLQYAIGVRPELLQLYIALKDSKNYEPISIRFGCSKPIKVDNDIPWLREELERYLDKYLGVTDIREAKREYLMNYAHKEGAPNNWKLNRYIWGIYNLLEETGFIRSQTAGKVSRKQAKFIEDFLIAIHLIDDVESKVDANNIRSRLNSLMKNYDSIEELTEELDYKSSPNNKGGIRLF
jgi:hypothetical protein